MAWITGRAGLCLFLGRLTCFRNAQILPIRLAMATSAQYYCGTGRNDATRGVKRLLPAKLPVGYPVLMARAAALKPWTLKPASRPSKPPVLGSKWNRLKHPSATWPWCAIQPETSSSSTSANPGIIKSVRTQGALTSRKNAITSLLGTIAGGNVAMVCQSVSTRLSDCCSTKPEGHWVNSKESLSIWRV